MYPSPLHTRFRLAPSGEAHIGHIVLAALSQEAARATGGTFTIRCQQLWATRESWTFDKYVKFARENIEDLYRLGIEPSHADVFLANGMSPAWAVQYTDDRGLIDAYWEKLRLDELWGSWPDNPRMATYYTQEEQFSDNNSWYLTQASSKHPYIQFAQLVGEVTTGRNFIIRGDDHLQDKAFADAFYPLIAKLHYRLPEIDRSCEMTPLQFFLPKLSRKSGLPISSSAGEATSGYYAKDIIAAGVTFDRLWRFMGRVLWGSYEKAEQAATWWSQQIPVGQGETNHLRPLPQPGPRAVLEHIQARTLVIDDTEWAEFMASGGKKLP